MRPALSLVVSIAVIAIFAVPAASVFAGAANANVPRIGGLYAGISSSTSTTWAGYVESSGIGSVTLVASSWVLPTVTCPTTGTEYDSFWIGIDGWSSNTVEQVGTLTECHAGKATSYVWWEAYPATTVQHFGKVGAGGAFNATVSYDPGVSSFVMSITDDTTGVTWTKITGSPGVSQDSAECISERLQNSTTGLVYKVPDFGSVSFSSCRATVSTVNGGIGSFASVYRVSATDPVKLVLKPSSLSAKTSFTVTWVRSQ